MSKRPSLASSMKALAEKTTPDPVTLVSKAKEPPPRAERASSKPGERYAGMKRMLIPIEPSLHRKLRVIVAQREGGTLEKVVQEAVAEYVAKYA